MIKIFTDGASIGNPGKVGIGYLIYKDNNLLSKKSLYFGVQSNNFAEYMALICALIDLISMGEKKCHAYTDSQLLSEQLKGNYKVKNNNIFPLFALMNELISKLDKFDISYIPREQNQEADLLAKQATGFLT